LGLQNRREGEGEGERESEREREREREGEREDDARLARRVSGGQKEVSPISIIRP